MAAPTHTDTLPLPRMLRACAEKYPRHTAISFDGRKTDFATFDAMSDRFAAGLAGRGVKKGDRIGLYCVNSDIFAVVYYGIVKAGAVAVPINLLLTPAEITYILKDAGATGLVYFHLFEEAALAVRAECDALELFVGIHPEEATCAGESFMALLADEGAVPAIEVDPAEDLVAIIYTSGTTGYPKGAMLTHRNLVSNTYSILEHMRFEPGKDIFIVVLPMFHAFAATVGMHFPLLHGCTLVPVPRFEPDAMTEIIQRESATIFMGVPSMYSVLLKLPEDRADRLASLKFCVSGGAAMPVAVMEAFEKKFGKLIYEGDGPTECSPVTCCNPIGGERKPASVGVPVPRVEMRILDESGAEPAKNEVAEICVRGPNVMKGYWNRPDDTSASFFEEWFRTGDLGYEDDDGYFYIVDRKKDMLIVNGMNVYPRIVEEVLYRYEPIREAAVVGEPHDTHGEIPVAYISLNPDAEATAAEVRAFCRDKLGRHQIPKKVHFMDELPKNATGKILKRELRRDGELERGVDLPRS